MRALNFTALFFFIGIQVFSQSFEWASTEHYSVTTYGSDLTSDDFGNIYVAGCYLDDGHKPSINSPYSGFLSKYTATGKKIWTITDVGMNLRIAATSDHLIVIGKKTTGTYAESYFIRKYDFNGKLIYTNDLFPRVEGSINSYIFDVAADSHGNYLISGLYTNTLTISHFTYVKPKQQADNPIYIAKFNSGNDLEWVKVATTGNAWFGRCNVSCDQFDKFYIYGEFVGTLHFLGHQFIPELSDGFLFKINGQGEALMGLHVKGAKQEQIASITVNDQEEIVLLGYHDADVSIGEFKLSPLQIPDGNLFLAVVSASGKVEWAKTIGSVGMDSPAEIAVSNDGKTICIAANSRSELIQIDGITAPNGNPGSYQSYLAWFSQNGSCQGILSTESQTQSGSVAMAMHSRSGYNYFTGMTEGTIKLGTHEISTGPRSMFISAVADNLLSAKAEYQHVAPAIHARIDNQMLIIKIPNSLQQQGRLRVLDVTGKIIYEDVFGPESKDREYSIKVHSRTAYILEVTIDHSRVLKKIISD